MNISRYRHSDLHHLLFEVCLYCQIRLFHQFRKSKQRNVPVNSRCCCHIFSVPSDHGFCCQITKSIFSSGNKQSNIPKQQNLHKTNHARRRFTYTRKLTPRVNYFLITMRQIFDVHQICYFQYTNT